MSLMDLIRRAWHNAVDTLTSHDHKTRPPDVDVLFMQELGKLDVDIQHIVAMLYSNYAGSKSSLDMISKDYEKLEEEHRHLKDERDNVRFELDEAEKHRACLKMDSMTAIKEINELKSENMTVIAKGTKVINECHGLIEALESSLNTSRYSIFLSGMCGFVLGLACLYLVV